MFLIDLSPAFTPDILNEGGLTACFTGPRAKELHGYDKTPYWPIVDQLTEIVTDLAGSGFTRFISGGAQGLDQLAFWAVNKAKSNCPGIENVVYAPFGNQPSRWSDRGLFGKAEYALMEAKADEFRILGADPDPSDYKAAVRLLYDRSHRMVDDSAMVVALLAGEALDWKNAKGGTAECVRYAAARKKPVLAVEYRPGSANPFALKIVK